MRNDPLTGTRFGAGMDATSSAVQTIQGDLGAGTLSWNLAPDPTPTPHP